MGDAFVNAVAGPVEFPPPRTKWMNKKAKVTWITKNIEGEPYAADNKEGTKDYYTAQHNLLGTEYRGVGKAVIFKESYEATIK